MDNPSLTHGKGILDINGMAVAHIHGMDNTHISIQIKLKAYSAMTNLFFISLPISAAQHILLGSRGC